MSTASATAHAAFAARFGREPGVVAVAPGRVNLIGEHTDYNEGFVLPMAIERATAVAAALRDDGVLRTFAANPGREVSIALDAPFSRQVDDGWMDYILGVIGALRDLGRPVQGMDLLITGDVPIGRGLSSSASLTMATLSALEALEGFQLDGVEGALLGQRVENEFLGLNCGIMDPFVIRLAREGHALLLDCRSRAYEHIPVHLPDARIVIADTGVVRGLTDSQYNARVAECQMAAGALQRAAGSNDGSLRDYTMEDLAAAENQISPAQSARARHVIGENARTLAAADALRAGDAPALGRLMNDSHESLRLSYEVSCKELDTLCDIGRKHPACLGARMTGAGFGGCTVHLVQRDAVDAYAGHLAARYRDATGLEAIVFATDAAAGASQHREP